MNGRGPRYDGCVNEDGVSVRSGAGRDAGWRVANTDGGRDLSVDAVLRPRDAPDARLGVEPPTGAVQFSFTRSVVAGWPVGDDAAAATDRHPSVGLGAVMLVEATSQLLLFS